MKMFRATKSLRLAEKRGLIFGMSLRLAEKRGLILGMAGALALSTLAQAGSTAQALHVTVPFPFVVAGQQFAAGEYDVRESDTGVILVRGTAKSAMAISYPAAAPKAGTPSSLRFQASESRKYLVGVHVDGETDRALPLHTYQERKITLSQAQ